jgi:hypothetical protein
MATHRHGDVIVADYQAGSGVESLPTGAWKINL